MKAFSVNQKLLFLPIIFITFGENLDDLKQFEPEEYVIELLGIHENK